LVGGLSRRQKRAVLLAVDAVLAVLSLLAALALVAGGVPDGVSPGWLAGAVLFVAATATVASAALALHRVKLNAYESTGALRSGVAALAVAFALAAMARATGADLPHVAGVLFGLLYLLACAGSRFAMLRLLLWVLRSGQPQRRVLIYGAGSTGVQLAAALRSHRTIFPVAFVDDNPALQGTTAGGLRIHGADRIEHLARNLEVDRILLAMPSLPNARRQRLTRVLEAMGLTVMAVPSFARLIGEEAPEDAPDLPAPGQFLGRQAMAGELATGAGAYAGRVVLVTGAGGSVGSELCRQLVDMRPRRLVLVEISEVALYAIDRELADRASAFGVEVVPVLGSVADARLCRTVLRDHGVEVVLHAAAYKHVPLVEANPLAGLANNVLGTRTLAEAAHEAGVKRFVLVSSDKAVRPKGVMGASKRLAELVVQDLARRSRGTLFSMVRFGNVLGSSGSVVPLFRDQIARGGPVTLTHPEVTRYFMTLHEAARLVLLAGSFVGSDGGDVFVLDMGRPMRIRDLAERMIAAAGCTLRSPANPAGDIEIAITGLRPGEKLHEELLIGEGLLTTPHPKILRAREDGLSELRMAAALRGLREAMAAGDPAAALAVVRSCVEGFGAAADGGAELPDRRTVRPLRALAGGQSPAA
jgi:FlaA1/EpsC-like NDP-sugar epimerase